MDEKLLALLITLFTAVTYLSGYGFLYGYYQYFDVGIWELNLSIQDILVHASSVFARTLSQFYLLLIVVVLATLLITVRFYGREIDLRRLLLASMPLVIAFLFISLSSSVGFGRSKASDELRLLNPFLASGLSNEVLDQSPLGLEGLQFLHLATTIDTFFVVGIHQTGRDRWIGRISRENELASFVYQDP